MQCYTKLTGETHLGHISKMWPVLLQGANLSIIWWRYNLAEVGALRFYAIIYFALHNQQVRAGGWGWWGSAKNEVAKDVKDVYVFFF